MDAYIVIVIGRPKTRKASVVRSLPRRFNGRVLVGPIFSYGAVSCRVAQAKAAHLPAPLNYQLSSRNAFC